MDVPSSSLAPLNSPFDCLVTNPASLISAFCFVASPSIALSVVASPPAFLRSAIHPSYALTCLSAVNCSTSSMSSTMASRRFASLLRIPTVPSRWTSTRNPRPMRSWRSRHPRRWTTTSATTKSTTRSSHFRPALSNHLSAPRSHLPKSVVARRSSADRFNASFLEQLIKPYAFRPADHIVHL